MEEQNPYAAPMSDPTPVFSPGRVGELQLASRGARFLGAFLDGLIMLVINLPLGFGFFIFAGDRRSMGFVEVMRTNSFIVSLVITVISAAAFIAINFHFWSTRGQSIGKMVAKTKIVRSDGSPADVSRIVRHRYLAMVGLGLIPLAGGFISLINVLLIFRREKNCLHDDIADTRVVVAN